MFFIKLKFEALIRPLMRMRSLEFKNGFNDRILLLSELTSFNFWSSIAKHCSCDDLINLINVEINSAVLIGPVCLSKGDFRQF